MKNRPTIALVSSSWISVLGLKTLLIEHFSTFKISLFFEMPTYLQSANQAPYDVVLTFGDVTIAQARVLDLNDSQESVLAQLHDLLDLFSDEMQDDKSPSLTLRETDVLRLVTKGFLNKEIADRLDISLHTVISHRKNITGKLGIKTVSGLTIYALMHGLIDGE